MFAMSEFQKEKKDTIGHEFWVCLTSTRVGHRYWAKNVVSV